VREQIIIIFAETMASGNHIQKTNAARLLEAAGVPYGLIPYEVDESNLAAEHVAAELGEPIGQVFKTLVLRGDRNGLFVCVMPGDMEVDLKVAARISGNKSCAMIHMKELLPETGYIRGGCSPIGMKKPLPTFIHESALLYDYIYISAGVRGLQLKINPEQLISFIGAEIYPL
jgi:Cys-tRNA(Pro)/Cys-tRNA(Cys) deacylase